MTITLYSAQLPPQTVPFVNSNGTLTSDDGASFLRQLLNRTGGPSGIPNTVGDDLTAEGTTQETALALTDDWNFVTTANAGGLLADLQPGQAQLVYNLDGAHNLSVYPPAGSQIDALGENEPYTLASLKMQIFWCENSTQLRSTQLG